MARSGYLAQNPGKTLGEVSRSGEQDGCALIGLTAPGDLVTLAAKRRAGTWTSLRRVEGVDLDDTGACPTVCDG